MADLDLPFEEGARGELLDEHVHYAGGLVVMAAVTPLPAPDGPTPTLVFRFARPDGSGFYPPFVLVLADGQMAKLRPLIMEAIAAARRAAATAT
jgi:hypothetical protein